MISIYNSLVRYSARVAKVALIGSTFLLCLSVFFVGRVFSLASDHMDSNSSLRPMRQAQQWGYVNPSGTFVIPPKFESAGPFSEGLAAVEIDGKFGYIDVSGQVVIDPEYAKAGPFNDGFAWVVTRKPFTPFGSGEYGIALYGKVTYIDHSGHDMMPPFSAEHISSFSEGLAAVRPGKIFGGCSGKVGYLNTHGEWAIKPQYDDADDFSEGLAAVNHGSKCHMGGKLGYIDRDGITAIPFQYDFAGKFMNGHACVEQDGSWKLINTAGSGISVPKSKCVP